MNALEKIEQPKPNIPDASEFSVMKETASMLVKTGFLPQAIKTPEQAIAIILTGRELGIGTMAALNTINVIQGKPTISPQLMLALIERSGQLENIEIEPNDAQSIRCTMKRKGRSAHTEFFGQAEAQALQLSGKDNYKKQAFTMYRWRAVAACARVVFPDVILGLYTPDEMGATVDEDGEIVTPPKPSVTTFRAPTAPTVEADVSHYEEQHDATTGTPEQHIKAKQSEVADLCKALNDGGDSILWSKATLHDYINATFEVTDGADSLSLASYDALIADLQERVDNLQK